MHDLEGQVVPSQLNICNRKPVRPHGVGSTDAPVIAGLSRWTTARGLYEEKTSASFQPREVTPDMEWGLRLEDAIAQAYEDDTGHALVKVPVQVHPEIPWMFASVDRRREDLGIVELKTASGFHNDEWGPSGSDEVPPPYLIQVQHQLAVTGAHCADLAALIGGNDFRIYHLPRRDDIIDRLIDIEREFWDRCVRLDPPEPDWWHPSTPKLLEAVYGLDPTKEVSLDDEALVVADAYRSTGESIAYYEQERREAKAWLLARLEGAAKGFLPDGRIITRRKVCVAEHMVKGHEYYRFNLKKANGS